MEKLSRQVRRAHRRLTAMRFFRVLPWALCLGLLLAAAAVTVDKFAHWGVSVWAYTAAGVGIGLLGAIVWTSLTRGTPLDAAIEIDRRFGLKERISSALAFPPSHRESQAAQAVWNDAVRQIDRIEVADEFRVRPTRWSWLPLAPAAVVALIAMFLNPASPIPAKATTATQEQIAESTKALRQKLIERRKNAEEAGLESAEDLFAKLERGTADLTEMAKNDQKRALIELNDLAQSLENRRNELGGADSMREQLRQLDRFQDGPADKLLDAVRQGNMDQALAELEKLREALKSGQLDEEDRQALAEQLADMEKKLNEVAEAQEKAENELERQIAEKRAAGDEQAAEALEKQLANLRQRAANQDMLRKLATQLGQCQECMGNGDQAGALESLEALEGELEQMRDELAELEMLDDAMRALAECKGGICQGLGDGQNEMMGNGNGRGIGHGQGGVTPPEDDIEAGFYDTKVRQDVGKGKLVVTDMVEGPNIRGSVLEEVQDQFDAAASGLTDPLTDQHLPREYREHARRYFDSLREGSSGGSP